MCSFHLKKVATIAKGLQQRPDIVFIQAMTIDNRVFPTKKLHNLRSHITRGVAIYQIFHCFRNDFKISAIYITPSLGLIDY